MQPPLEYLRIFGYTISLQTSFWTLAGEIGNRIYDLLQYIFLAFR